MKLKCLLLAIKEGIRNYAEEDALDYFFSHLLLPDLNIPFEEYEKEKRKHGRRFSPSPPSLDAVNVW